ncbi:carbon-nitrogen hydrolase family protein [Viridibacterium curvum]|uniref:Carbon-nitrogen hydrolase family protein n=1 Tax=Viridibacterium curvum TaxID=1101404 RepID=A0ABP9QJ35_9RHOO
MSTRFKLAAVQMISGPDVAANLREAERLIAGAAAAGATGVVLPEYFCLLSPDDKAKVGIRENEARGPLQTFLADAARRHKVWLIGGTIPMVSDSPELVRNASLVFDDEGHRVARYDKLHLFNFDNGRESYDEARSIEAGSDVVVFDAPWGSTGLSICYDLRFPELFRHFGAMNLIVVPAAFTATTGRAHWEVLLRARAIENQCYVLASGQGGEHPHGRHTWGHSMLIDPWGEIVASMELGAGFIVGELDLQRITEVRDNLPALRHRKLV